MGKWCGNKSKQEKPFLISESGISPIIGTLILLALSTVVVTAGAAVSNGAIDVPTPAPKGDFQIRDAPSELSTDADELMWIKHQGGDALNITNIEVVVTNLNESKSVSHQEGKLVLKETGMSDGEWEMGETLVVSELECPDEDSDGGHMGGGHMHDGGEESDCWPEFNHEDELIVRMYHLPTEEVIMTTGANIE